MIVVEVFKDVSVEVVETSFVEEVMVLAYTSDTICFLSLSLIPSKSTPFVRQSIDDGH